MIAHSRYNFQRFNGFATNPAWLVAKSLPPVLQANAAHPSRIRITVHPEPLAVEYEACEVMLEKALESGQIYHLVLHMGVAKGLEGYKIERLANSSGYTERDALGKLPSKSTQPAYWGDQIKMTTSAHMPDVVTRWKSEVPVSSMTSIADGRQGPITVVPR